MPSESPPSQDKVPNTRHEQDLVNVASLQADARDMSFDAAETVAAGSVGSGASLDLPSDSFAGYRLTAKLHGGGQGVVYKAIQISTGKQVALKAIHHGPLADPRNRARLERGVHILSQLDHPHIVRIIDSGGKNGAMFYVMDYIPGNALDDWLSAWRTSSLGGFGHGQAQGVETSRRQSRESSRRQKNEIELVLQLFVKICDAVAAAHVRGVIHRDLKPGNIRIDERGEPHVLDFDLAKIMPGDLDPDGRWMDMTQTGEFLGSLRWASPEQVERDPSKIDLRTDIYSLGVVLYEMLTGQSPYPTLGTRRDLENHILNTEPARPSSLRRRVDADVDTIVQTCLAKEPQRRYSTAGALADDIRAYLAGSPISAQRGNSWYLLRSLIKRHSGVAVTAASLIVIAISAAFISSWFYFGERQATREKEVVAKQSLQQAQFWENQSQLFEANLPRMTLGWFLLEWGADRLERAKQIRDENPAKSPEWKAMQFLLDPTYTQERFLAELPDIDSAMGHLVVGERHFKAGEYEKARQANEAALKVPGGTWYNKAARARLEQIAQQQSTGNKNLGSQTTGDGR